MIKVGCRKITKEQIQSALDDPSKKVDYGLSQAEPLILKDIVYDFDFEYDMTYLNKLKDLEKEVVLSLY